jgi:hypothetical protein
MHKKCIFCQDDERKITKEHLFPDWLSKMYDSTVTGINEGTNADGTIAYSYTSKIFQQTANSVCEVCNNGWMSQVENDVKPILSKMLRGKSFVLDKKSQIKLSTWAMKTMLVFNHENPSPPAKQFIPPEHYVKFYEQKKVSEENVMLLGYIPVGKFKAGQRIASNWIDVAENIQVPKELAADLAKRHEEGHNVYGVTLSLANIVFQLHGHDLVDGSEHKVEILVSDEPMKILNPYKYKIRWPLRHNINEVGGLEAIHAAVKGGKL